MENQIKECKIVESLEVLKQLQIIKQKHTNTSEKQPATENSKVVIGKKEIVTKVVIEGNSEVPEPTPVRRRSAFQTTSKTPSTIQSDKSISLKPEETIQIQTTDKTVEQVTSKDEDHVTPENDKDEFKCEKCQQNFIYLKRFNAHKIKGACGMKDISCPQCAIKLKNVKSLKSHIKQVHERPVYQCVHCMKFFPSKGTVTNHINSAHTISKCKFCEKLFNNKNTLRSHRNRCKLKTSNSVKLTTGNMQEDKTEKEVSSDINTDELNREDENDTKKICEATDISDKEGKKIETANIEKTKRKCVHCKKTFLSRSGLNKHLKTHLMMKENISVEQTIPEDENSLNITNEAYMKLLDNPNNFILQQDVDNEEVHVATVDVDVPVANEALDMDSGEK